MSEFQIKAYAKINLGLDVIGRLPNGYHQVKMIMQSIELHDELTLEPTKAGILLTTDTEELSTAEDNLVYKAAKYMLEKYDISSGLRVHLKKRIPIAAGMAGGSTDAAAVMKGINQIFDLGLSTSQLMEDGVAMGADVPYCILGGTALAEGIGERLTPLVPLPACYILIAKPNVSVSTKYVYEHLDAQGIQNHPDIDGMKTAIQTGGLTGIARRMENVLETVTIPAYPMIADIKNKMRCLGAMNSLMSGSGPTVFGLFQEQEAAQTAFQQLSQENSTMQVFLTTAI